MYVGGLAAAARPRFGPPHPGTDPRYNLRGGKDVLVDANFVAEWEQTNN